MVKFCKTRWLPYTTFMNRVIVVGVAMVLGCTTPPPSGSSTRECLEERCASGSVVACRALSRCAPHAGVASVLYGNGVDVLHASCRDGAEVLVVVPRLSSVVVTSPGRLADIDGGEAARPTPSTDYLTLKQCDFTTVGGSRPQGQKR